MGWTAEENLVVGVVLEDSSNALEAGKQYFLADPFPYFHSSVEHGLDSSGIERKNFEGSSES